MYIEHADFKCFFMLGLPSMLKEAPFIVKLLIQGMFIWPKTQNH